MYLHFSRTLIKAATAATAAAEASEKNSNLHFYLIKLFKFTCWFYLSFSHRLCWWQREREYARQIDSGWEWDTPLTWWECINKNVNNIFHRISSTHPAKNRCIHLLCVWIGNSWRPPTLRGILSERLCKNENTAAAVAATEIETGIYRAIPSEYIHRKTKREKSTFRVYIYAWNSVDSCCG